MYLREIFIFIFKPFGGPWTPVWNPLHYEHINLHFKNGEGKSLFCRVYFFSLKDSPALQISWRYAITVTSTWDKLQQNISHWPNILKPEMIFNNVMFVLIDSFIFWFACALLIFLWMYLCRQSVPCFFDLVIVICWYCLHDQYLPGHFQTSSLFVRQQHNTVSNVCTMQFWSSAHCESYQARLQLSNMGNIHY